MVVAAQVEQGETHSYIFGRVGSGHLDFWDVGLRIPQKPSTQKQNHIPFAIVAIVKSKLKSKSRVLLRRERRSNGAEKILQWDKGEEGERGSGAREADAVVELHKESDSARHG